MDSDRSDSGASGRVRARAPRLDWAQSAAGRRLAVTGRAATQGGIGERGDHSHRVCRSSGVPGGYVATDYIASRDCPAIKDRAYNAMLVEDISVNPIGSTV